MAEAGLRERKKARTHRLIAEVAARLFAELGYEQVTVTDIAREAEVSEQTVYNYFPTKDLLVTDRDQQIQSRLVELIRTRAPDVSPAAAIRDFVLADVDAIPGTAPEVWRGELGYLAATSPTVHRLALEMINRQAEAITSAISDTTAVPESVAQLQGIALAGVFQIIISRVGHQAREGRPPKQIAQELRPIIAAALDELDRWFTLAS